MRHACILLACALLGPAARAQLVLANDQVTSPTIWLVDVTGVRPPRALVTGAPVARVNALTADDPGRVLYWLAQGVLYRADFAPSGPLAPVTIGTVTGVPNAPQGLAWDGTRLIAQSTAGLHVLDPVTAVATALTTESRQDFGGLDADPQSGVLYAANDSLLTTPLVGRGVYRIEPPWSAPVYTRIALYPGTATDIDGLAVGPGRAYLVQQAGTTQVQVLDLVGGTYLAPLPSPFTGTGATAGAAWAPGLMATTPVSDLSVSVIPPASCSIAPGGSAVFTVRIASAGPQPSAASASVTLPASAGFAGSLPPLTPAAGVLHWAPGLLQPGASSELRVTLVPAAPGVLSVSASVSGSIEDPAQANNTAVGSTTVRVAAPASASAVAVLATLGPLAAVPGEPAAAWVATGTGIGRPFPSPSGRVWAARCEVSASGAAIVRGEGGGLSVPVRTGIRPMVPSAGAPDALPRTLDRTVAVDDEGRLAFSGETDEAAAVDGCVVRIEGGVCTRVAQESVSVPAMGPNVWYGTRRGGVALLDGGWVAYVTTLQGPGVTPSSAEAIVGADGAQVIARAGTMVPSGQVGGEFAFYKRFDDGQSLGLGWSMHPAGWRWAATGAVDASDASPPPGGHDAVAVIDGAVAVQENSPGVLGGCVGRDGQPAEWVLVDRAGGAWVVGACNDGRAWAARDGAVVAVSGDPIAPGLGERWASGPGAILLVAPGDGGARVIAGRTDAGGLTAQAAVREDGRVVLRSNDPVDLNGNGTFDDGVYIQGFKPHHGFLDASGVLWVVVTLRGEDAALCGGPDTGVGEALVRVATSPAGCDPDFNVDGNVDQDDVSALIEVVGGGANPGGRDPDFNQDGNVDQDDVTVLINAVGGGGCP